MTAHARHTHRGTDNFQHRTQHGFVPGINQRKTQLQGDIIFSLYSTPPSHVGIRPE